MDNNNDPRRYFKLFSRGNRSGKSKKLPKLHKVAPGGNPAVRQRPGNRQKINVIAAVVSQAMRRIGGQMENYPRAGLIWNSALLRASTAEQCTRQHTGL